VSVPDRISSPPASIEKAGSGRDGILYRRRGFARCFAGIDEAEKADDVLPCPEKKGGRSWFSDQQKGKKRWKGLPPEEELTGESQSEGKDSPRVLANAASPEKKNATKTDISYDQKKGTDGKHYLLDLSNSNEGEKGRSPIRCAFGKKEKQQKERRKGGALARSI